MAGADGERRRQGRLDRPGFGAYSKWLAWGLDHIETTDRDATVRLRDDETVEVSARHRLRTGADHEIEHRRVLTIAPTGR